MTLFDKSYFAEQSLINHYICSIFIGQITVMKI